MPSQLIITGRIKIIYTLKEELLESKELQNKIFFPVCLGQLFDYPLYPKKSFQKK